MALEAPNFINPPKSFGKVWNAHCVATSFGAKLRVRTVRRLGVVKHGLPIAGFVVEKDPSFWVLKPAPNGTRFGSQQWLHLGQELLQPASHDVSISACCLHHRDLATRWCRNYPNFKQFQCFWMLDLSNSVSEGNAFSAYLGKHRGLKLAWNIGILWNLPKNVATWRKGICF